MTNMNMPDMWENETALIAYLALQLSKGRLGLFLGAGTSVFYGLPSWDVLVRRLCDEVGETAPATGSDLLAKAQVIRSKHFRANPGGFKAALKAALYEGVTLDFAKIRQNDTLAAIGSLVMSSKRGSAAKVITLNYDDLLENYLQFHGFTTATIASENHWNEVEDVVIYHPHGFLPLGAGHDSDKIVLTTDEYLEIMHDSRWRPMLQTALRTHTFLYLGLSGADLHLQSLWRTLKTEHAIALDRVAYHGVRFKTAGDADDLRESTEDYGIFTHDLDSYNDLPSFLFKICQVARDLRIGIPL